jgi:hypothetical protein
MNALQEMPLFPLGILNRLFKRPNKRNALVELNNLLVRATKPEEISVGDVAAIEEKYGVIISKRCHDFVCTAYEAYINECLADKKLSDQEIQSLAHFKTLLSLTDVESIEIENRVKANIYGANVAEALADGKMTEEEYQFLKTLESEIHLPEDIAVSIYKEKGSSLLKRVFDQSISDRRLSPEEEAEFTALSKSLHITVEHDENTLKWLDKFRLLWRIENADLPVVDANINIQKSEVCYLSCAASWHESRSVVRRINYGGPALRIKIAKGLYWRAGSYSVNAQRQDVMQLIDSGTLYLTNKRLIFMGGRGNKVISLSKVLDFEAYTDGIKIQKESGKDPMIQFSADGEVFAAIFGRAIRDCAH